jgi:hypothetical protein
MIIIPDKLRRPAEVERDELRKQLAEARAEIERKNAIIGQMREALLLALPEARSTHVEQMILAALKAERGRVMGKAIDLLNERINWLEDEIHEMEKNSATAINNGKTGWSIAAGLLQHRERKMNALYELKAVLAEALK